jgi:predicted negative regulator of RcsB-dependent stress response
MEILAGFMVGALLGLAVGWYAFQAKIVRDLQASASANQRLAESLKEAEQLIEAQASTIEGLRAENTQLRARGFGV